MAVRGIEVGAAAAVCGCGIGSMYLSQAIGLEMVQEFGLAPDAAGIVSMTTLMSYSMSLLLVLCMGAHVNNRYFVTATTALSAASLIGIGLSGSLTAVLFWSLVFGASSVGAQMLLAHLSSSAAPATRGRVIGIVMGGLLSGIMISRPLGHLITDVYGWRTVFLSVGAVMVLMSILVFALIRDDRDIPRMRYLTVVKRVTAAPLTSAALRSAMIFQGAAFFVFNLVWSAAPIALSMELGMRNRDIALFSLVGIGGVGGAVLAGWISDIGLSVPAITIALFSIIAALGLSLYGVGVHQIVAIAIGVFLVDCLVQLNQVLNQRNVLDISERFRGAFNAAFMTSVFIAGSLGSLSGAVLYNVGGWALVALTGTAAIAAALFYRTRRGDDMEAPVQAIAGQPGTAPSARGQGADDASGYGENSGKQNPQDMKIPQTGPPWPEPTSHSIKVYDVKAAKNPSPAGRQYVPPGKARQEPLRQHNGR